jgi:nicotinamidase-related amidase
MLQRDTTALVVVDIQGKLLSAIHEHERVLRNSLLLMRMAQVLELPVVLTTQYRKGLGDTLPEVLAAAPGVEPLDKVSFGCFGDDAIAARLAGLGRSQLVVCGIEAHICVAQTVIGARERGLEVHVAGDAVGSRAADGTRRRRAVERGDGPLRTPRAQRRRRLQADAAVSEGVIGSARQEERLATCWRRKSIARVQLSSAVFSFQPPQGLPGSAKPWAASG